MTDLEHHPYNLAAVSAGSQMDGVDPGRHDGHNRSMSHGSLLPVASHDRPLSQLLRERTISVHTEAERTGVIADIIRRKADRNGYALFLRNILPAYEQLEAELSKRSGHPVLGSFAQGHLFRSDRLRNDLARIAGSEWEQSLPLLRSGVVYADCVTQAGAGDGLRLVSHAYVRFFGDLSGGQSLKKLLGKSLSLPEDALRFYDFPGLDVQSLKTDMRDALDRAGRIAEESDCLVMEAISAFEHNIWISREVQDKAAVPAAAPASVPELP